MKGHYDPTPTGALQRRYENTLRFLRSVAPPPASVLDLGPPNPLAHLMEREGYSVSNTSGDLDLDLTAVTGSHADVATAFEILEHLVAPFNVLRAIPCTRLVATVPLRLWFAKAYRNRSDSWDRHFHEFEDWQFDWLLEKSGWQIVRREKWTSPIARVGFRPLLRLFAKRYYAIEAVRSTESDG